jgi:hypothetical protein
MELRALKLVITDADLNGLVTRHLPKDAPVSNLNLHVVEGAVELTGTYPTRLLNISFHITWEPSIQGKQIAVRMGNIRVAGLPVLLLRGLFLSGFRKVADEVPGAHAEGDTLWLDIDRLLASKGIPLKSNLRSLRCEPGQIIIEG